MSWLLLSELDVKEDSLLDRAGEGINHVVHKCPVRCPSIEHENVAGDAEPGQADASGSIALGTANNAGSWTSADKLKEIRQRSSWYHYLSNSPLLVPKCHCSPSFLQLLPIQRRCTCHFPCV